VTPDGASPTRIGRTNRILALTIAAFTCVGGVASAGSGGGAQAGGGGTGATLPGPPQLKKLACLEKCAAENSAIQGATVALIGKSLGEVAKVSFAGEGAAVVVKPDEVAQNRVVASVPEGAVSGRPRVSDRYGQRAKSPVPLKIVDQSQLPAQDTPGTGDITVTPETAFFDSQTPITVTYLYKGNSAGDVRIELVNLTTGEVVGSWVQQGAQPGSYMTFDWDGLVAEDQAPPSGEYKFRVGPSGGELEDGGTASFFSLYDHRFPIRGKHTYGDGVGAARKGHSHQGQDVFAKCGTPLVAARGGKVQYAGYHGSAGNYIVIDGKGTGRDYAYMHLTDKVAFKEGDRVYTGQEIGTVGESGNASGCHLHFEIWSAPGWYEGGSFLKSVTRELKKWDSWS
jgi:murein DD-endopeptidase MepM/ murein hydrolase activator NlpD